MQAMMWVALLPLAAAFGLWAVQRPVRLFAAYAAVMPFGSVFAVPLGLPRSFTTASSILGGVTTVVLAWHIVRHRRSTPPLSGSSGLWLIFLGLSAASVAWSLKPATSVDDVFVLGSLVLLYLVVVLYPFSPRDLARVADGIIVGTAITGAYGVFLALTSNLQTTRAGVSRFEITGAGGGEGGDPNITAAALLLGFAVALHGAFRPTASIRQRSFYVAATMLGGAGITLTASRGGLLAMVAIVIYTVLTHGRGIALVLALAMVVIPSVFLVPDTLAERIDNTGTSGRSQIWEIALESCPEHCAVGSGLGTFPDVHERGLLTTPDATGTKLRFQAHSIWLEVLVELGVIGLALFASALLLLGNDLRQVPLQSRYGAGAGFLALLVTGSFLSSTTFKYFWLVLMYATVVVNVNRLHGRRKPRRRIARAHL